MIERKCRTCGKPVLVEFKKITMIRCDDCSISQGYLPKTKRDFDTDGLIYCRVCNTVKRRMDLHIKKEHSLTIEEYLQQYPNSPIYSRELILKKHSRDAESRKKTGDKIRASWSNPEIKEKWKASLKIHCAWKGKKLSPEHRYKIGKAADHFKRNTVQGKRNDIAYFVRSKDEANMCRMLDYANIRYEYETKFFELNGTLLILDFYLYQKFEFIKIGHLEVKGWKSQDGYFSNKEKFDVFKEKYPDDYSKTTILFCNSDEWKFLENKYKDLIPMWETGNHNLYTHPEIYDVERIDKKEKWIEFLYCPLCLNDGKGEIRSRVQFLSSTHLSTHGYTIERFKQEFPNQKLKIDSLCENQSKKLTGKKRVNK